MTQLVRIPRWGRFPTYQKGHFFFWNLHRRKLNASMSGQLNWSLMFLHWFSLYIITPVPKLSDAELRAYMASWACFLSLVYQLHEIKGEISCTSNWLTFLRNEETEQCKDFMFYPRVHKELMTESSRTLSFTLMRFKGVLNAMWCYQGEMMHPFSSNDGD